MIKKRYWNCVDFVVFLLRVRACARARVCVCACVRAPARVHGCVDRQNYQHEVTTATVAVLSDPRHSR